MAHYSHKLINFQYIRLVLAFIISCYPSIVSAQQPVKDLTHGNIFYYFFSQGNLTRGYFFEKIVGDTIILGRTYAKVYSDPWRFNNTTNIRSTRYVIDTIRYERSNDSALFEWVPKEQKEYLRLRHIPAYKAKDTCYFKNPILDCSHGCVIGLDRRTIGIDLDGNDIAWSFLFPSSGAANFTITYLLSIGANTTNNGEFNQFRGECNLVGIRLKSQYGAWGGTSINFIQQLDTLLQTSRITVGVREQEAATSLTLAPNPVSDEANVSFSLASSKHVRLVVVDNLGRVLLSLADEQLPAGEHRFPVRTEALANGVYWVRLWADAAVQTVPLVVRK